MTNGYWSRNEQVDQTQRAYDLLLYEPVLPEELLEIDYCLVVRGLSAVLQRVREETGDRYEIFEHDLFGVPSCVILGEGPIVLFLRELDPKAAEQTSLPQLSSTISHEMEAS